MTDPKIVRGFVIASSVLLVLVILFAMFNPNINESIFSKKEDTVISEETVTDPKTAYIDDLLSEMSDSQKAGQLFLARVPSEGAIADIEDFGLGGYLIFGRDVENETVGSLTEKITSWQESSNIPMLIGSDEEGGTVTRVSDLLDSPFLSPGELYAEGGIDLIYQDTLEKSNILKNMGINLNLAPVADVALDSYSFIYDRTLELPYDISLEEAAETTASYVAASVEAMKSVGIGCSLKHFPGYGENADTHTDIITDYKDLETFEEIDFIPFKAGIDAGAGSVLISHNIAVAIDPDQPASISPAVHNVLRNELGFNGVILTDDLDMAGLADFIDKDKAAVATINAGTDMIISSTYYNQIDLILSALEDGTLNRDRFEEAVRHVLGWKYDLGLFTGTEEDQ